MNWDGPNEFEYDVELSSLTANRMATKRTRGQVLQENSCEMLKRWIRGGPNPHGGEREAHTTFHFCLEHLFVENAPDTGSRVCVRMDIHDEHGHVYSGSVQLSLVRDYHLQTGNDHTLCHMCTIQLRERHPNRYSLTIRSMETLSVEWQINFKFARITELLQSRAHIEYLRQLVDEAEATLFPDGYGRRRGRPADIAYQIPKLNDGEVITPGSVVFVVYVDGELKCTQKHDSGFQVFGHTVVTGRLLQPYAVGKPFEGSGVLVVYMGHAYVRVPQDLQVRPGTWLVASGKGDGFALPEGSNKDALRIGQVLAAPILHEGENVVHCFIPVIGSGNNSLEQQKQRRELDVKIRKVLVQVRSQQMLLTDIETQREI